MEMIFPAQFFYAALFAFWGARLACIAAVQEKIVVGVKKMFFWRDVFEFD